MSKQKIEKLEKSRKDNLYYLMSDILSCFPDNFKSRFLNIINNHFIAKEATRQILMDEIKKPKPKFRILAGALILQNSSLRQTQGAALHEVISTVGALKFCFSKSPYKTVKKLSVQVILRLFATLYIEYIIMPVRKEEGEIFLGQFKKHFSRNDTLEAMNTERLLTRFIFEDHGIAISYDNNEKETKLTEILDKFYTEEK